MTDKEYKQEAGDGEDPRRQAGEAVEGAEQAELESLNGIGPVKAKAIIQAFYGSAPRLSYWNGCSTGGRQGLKEAQEFPDDYDGIIAGAPATRTAISLWIAAAVLKDPASYISPGKYPIIHQAALAACDSRDGLKDGHIDDPTKCDFDPNVLLCKGDFVIDMRWTKMSDEALEDSFVLQYAELQASKIN
jgi:hypothetical protein